MLLFKTHTKQYYSRLVATFRPWNRALIKLFLISQCMQWWSKMLFNFLLLLLFLFCSIQCMQLADIVASEQHCLYKVWWGWVGHQWYFTYIHAYIHTYLYRVGHWHKFGLCYLKVVLYCSGRTCVLKQHWPIWYWMVWIKRQKNVYLTTVLARSVLRLPKAVKEHASTGICVRFIPIWLICRTLTTNCESLLLSQLVAKKGC